MRMNIRIKNIEFRQAHGFLDENKTYYEIVKWEPKENYVPNLDDWTKMENSDMYFKTDNPSCFADLSSIMSAETCYTLSTFDIIGDSIKIHEIDDRVISLIDEDLKTYMSVARIGWNALYDTLQDEKQISYE